MAKRRRTVQHLWNRFMAAVLFVLGAALNTAAPTESQETRVSRAVAIQLEAAAHFGRQLSTALAVKFDDAGNDGADQPAFTPTLVSFAGSTAGRAPAIPSQPARYAHHPARDGDSRAPPSA